MTFDLEFLKTILGVVSIFGATVSGVMALLVEYRDKETGKITKWGRYAIFGLAISFLVGISNAWIDYTQKSQETANAADQSRKNTEQTLKIVSDINRTLSPFKDIRLNFRISYPFDHPDLARYRQRLDEGVRALLPEIRSREVQGVSSKLALGDKVLIVTINEGSPLFPNQSSEYLASQVFSRRGLTLNFFKTPIDPSTFDIGNEAHPDIEMSFKEHEDKEQIEVEYDLVKKTITFSGGYILSKPETWNSSGNIVSMLDLPGTQLIIQLEYDIAATEYAHVLPPNVPFERINLPHSILVFLRIADRRRWVLPKEKFELYKGRLGTTNFVYSFPKTYEEILIETKSR